MYLMIIYILCLIDISIKYNTYIKKIHLLTSQLISISIHKIHNHGFAFSLYQKINYKFKLISHTLIYLILLLTDIFNRNIYVEAILIAAFCNLLDRYLCEYIIDYIKIKIFDNSVMPIFNICDIIIVINICLLLINV